MPLESLLPILSVKKDGSIGLVVGQDMEVTNAEGRWHHVQRAQTVDEAML